MKNTTKKRYAIVGLGSRSIMFTDAILGPYKDTSELVALCDVNSRRMDYQNSRFLKKFGARSVPAYMAGDFERMIRREKPDVVIVTSVDRTHHQYLIRAMELGCDAITEKPMTIDEEKCRLILDAVERDQLGWPVGPDIRGPLARVVDLEPPLNVSRDPGVETAVRAPEHVNAPRPGECFWHAVGTIQPG